MTAILSDEHGPMESSQNSIDKAKSIFRAHGGLLRTSQAIRLGIHPRTLYEMRDTGVVDRLGRGVYRLAGLPVLGDPDLAAVAVNVPQGVICLISALSLHEITTQVPHEVYVALQRGTTKPRLDYPPIRLFWFSGAAFEKGVATQMRDGILVRVYTAEKTLADCFKYRHKIGIDVAVESMRLYLKTKPLKVDELLRFARVCRVEKVMRPYLEALV